MNKLSHLIVTVLIGLSLAVCQTTSAEAGPGDPLDAYNVVWNTPSTDHNGSMPIGNGDIGMNVWVDPSGDLWLLLSKTNAWSENGRLLKLGRVRIRLAPNPFVEGVPFQQTLRLRKGEIVIKAGAREKAVTVAIWVDANNPVIHVEVDSAAPVKMHATLDLWRTARRELTGKEAGSAYGLQGAPFNVYVHPDTVLDGSQGSIIWRHRNEESIWENNLKHQGLEGFIAKSADPLLSRTFGGRIEGPGLRNEDATTLKSPTARKQLALSIYPHCAQTESAEQWIEQLDRSVARCRAQDLDTARRNHRAWWNAFWNRSWIRVTGSPDLEAVTRGYTLQRWITACAGRGAHAIKFNGTIFTVDGAGYDADYRSWGGPYWWQNTRLPYWPMLACGDFDMMAPLFGMYQDMMPLAEYRTKTWFDHDGAFIGETVYFWGMYNNTNYGWERPADLHVSELTNRYIRREYTASPELMAMMLDYCTYTGDAEFLRETLLPMSDSLLTFWDQHYQTDAAGHMRMYPGQALETLQDAENPTPDVAGLRWVLKGLLALPPDETGSTRRRFWKQLVRKVPPLPMEEKEGKRYILGAGKVHGGRGNSENPELYAIFPFRLYGVGKGDLETGRRTFERRAVKGNNGWRQDDTQAAFLGLTETAADYVVSRAKNKHAASRFGAFWGPNFDWIPDQTHGGNLMMTLQTMLLQADDGKIRLLPAWPKQWDVDFKLHAPHQTIIEGRLKDGQLVNLNVTPKSRRKDIVVIGSNHRTDK
ncbi:MAG: hypothetical protein CMJ83_04315 [Planctomycetes bacterium]|nr:hypothetical protein [Planctomycetota bacterium]